MAVKISTILITKGVIEPKEENYKAAVEEHITSFMASKPEFSSSNYKEYHSRSGDVIVENTYKINEIEHSYVAKIESR